MRQLTFIIFLFSYHLVSTQTFHALTIDQYENYLTVQTTKQAQLKSGYKKINADFRTTYKTDYKSWNLLFPPIENILDTNTVNQEISDTIFRSITSGQVNFVGNLKRNDTIIYKVFNITEENISTTLDGSFKKRRKSYGNYILDVKGKLVGEISDFGNNTFQSIKDDRLLLCSSKDVPGKTNFIDPFSNELRTHFQTDSGAYIFVVVKYFKDDHKEKIRTR